MAHKMFKPYSLLMYFLAVIAFFFLGLVYAEITEAGKGQMMAGGAIVFGYGVIGAFIGFCLSLVLAYYNLKRHLILRINGVLVLIIIASFTYFTIKYQNRQQEKQEKKQQEIEQRKTKKPTVPIDNQTASINRYAGKIQYWPEFLLGVHSVEFIESSKQKVYARPFDYAGAIATPYSFFVP